MANGVAYVILGVSKESWDRSVRIRFFCDLRRSEWRAAVACELRKALLKAYRSDTQRRLNALGGPWNYELLSLRTANHL
jgi:hypothetical protein